MLVVLTLTGFSTSSGGKSGKSSSRGGSGGGGGCSSSKQDHDSSSSDTSGGYRYGNTTGNTSSSGSSGSSTASSLKDGIATLVSCASEKQPYATVKVRNPNSRRAQFVVIVRFKDAAGEDLDYGNESVTVPAGGTATVKLDFNDLYVDELDRCEVKSPEAYPV
ncbi:hypothetical protein ACIQAC_28425 [Streptomyces sp. NPDC088387]|uniref:hypothetical protein n=1 Tax=Streptomyces sp. NPDC088387 TaxID=3365859 RepID=UPI00380FF69B